jgi:predicted nucleic acid-binding protein
MRVVLDPDVIVAAMRSATGASAALLRAARAGPMTITGTVPACLEYEAVCSKPEHGQAGGLAPREVALFRDAVIGLVEPAHVWFLWRPQLRDADDELVLEAAINGRADTIVTFNRRDFRRGAELFGVDVVLPSEAIRRVQ